MSVKEKIRSYIVESITFGDPIGDDESLLNSGVIDSTGAMEMILFLEETFDIVIGDEEILPDNFDTVDLAAAFVENKLKEAA